MPKNARYYWLFIAFNSIIVLLACSVAGGQATAIPAGRPASFDVQTATPTPDPQQATAEPEELEPEAIVIVPLDDAPTPTPDPNATPTLPPRPTASPTLPLPTPSPTAPPTNTPTPSLPTSAPAAQSQNSDLDPPRQGGDWDFETDFVPWPNPHGEPCPGAAVASGWTAFVERGQFGSSCLNENSYGPNVFSGFKSQEITFDFIAANSGIFRTITTQPGHRYNIVAYAKHDRSTTPVEMFLGVDLTGGGDWQAETVQWFPWDSNTQDAWGATEETVTVTGEQMTIFIRGVHPLAEQGGKTVVDNVSVTDLGL